MGEITFNIRFVFTIQYVYFCGLIFWKIGEKVSNLEQRKNKNREIFVLESRVFRRNGKKHNSIGNLFGTLATTQWIASFLQYPERSFSVVIMPTVTLRPVQTLRIILLHPWKNINNGAIFTSWTVIYSISLSILNFPTVTRLPIDMRDFTDRGEPSNSRAYGEILEPLIIERETRNLLLSLFQSIFFPRYWIKNLSV